MNLYTYLVDGYTLAQSDKSEQNQVVVGGLVCKCMHVLRFLRNILKNAQKSNSKDIMLHDDDAARRRRRHHRAAPLTHAINSICIEILTAVQGVLAIRGFRGK